MKNDCVSILRVRLKDLDRLLTNDANLLLSLILLPAPFESRKNRALSDFHYSGTKLGNKTIIF